MNASLFSNTPSVTVLDNRGLSVRDIAYYRHPNEPTTTQTRITHHQYDTRGALKQSADPRLHQSGKANFHYLTGLAGHALRTQGVDNGTSVSLSDAAGRAFIAVNNISTAADGSEDKSHAVTRTWQYEGASLPGRLLSITEQVTGDAARITERFVYASNTEAEKAHNLAGQCISHYDTAGLVQTDSIALTGVALSVSRRFLKDADNPDVVADWQGGDASVWNDQLSKEDYVTLTTTDATGTVLTTTDTKGNVQRVAYDVSGLMSGSWLTLKGKAEQTIVKSLMYSAAGQKLREEQGNGVVTTYSYEPETQRLIGIRTERSTGHAVGAKVLQDLRYEYDPVGNVLKINNDAEETRFWRNQKVVPENTYTYDSLYQLVKATGREMANAGQQSNHLPSATIPFSSDSSAYTKYTRTYTYDEVGNLTQVKHSSPATSNNYTTTLTVSDSSNRSVQSTLTENVSDVDGFFTVGGQQNQLQLGQHLIWTPRNELLKVTPVIRDGDVDDVESYRYDAGSQRLLKVSKQKAANSVQTLRALYLPGIELRSVAQGSTETENLQVITIGEAGRAQVRVLHWENGRPEDISNDQVRYSYDNLIGSSALEVDGDGKVISMEEYYPYGGTAILTARNQTEVNYKTVRYSGKERDATGLYYYGYRYYQPWVGRWLSPDQAGTVDGLNLYRMVRNNPVTLFDNNGLFPNSELSPYTRISQISMLGTHDSGTSSIKNINMISVCQRHSLIEQAYIGAQYFDIRVRTNKAGDWKFYHGEKFKAFGGFNSTERAVPAVRELFQFAETHPENLFIFKFHFDKGKDSKAKIKEFVSQVSSDYERSLIQRSRRRSKLGNLTIGETIDIGKNIALLAHHSGKAFSGNENIWNYKENTYGGWGNTPDPDALISHLTGNLGQDRNEILVSQTNLPSFIPPSRKIAKNWQALGGLEKLATSAHEKVAKEFTSVANNKGANPGIISMDFIGTEMASTEIYRKARDLHNSTRLTSRATYNTVSHYW